MTKFVWHYFPQIVEVRKYNCNYHKKFITAAVNLEPKFIHEKDVINEMQQIKGAH